jgi:hypothetical protein
MDTESKTDETKIDETKIDETKIDETKEDAPKYTDKQLNDLIKKEKGKEFAKALEKAGIKDAEELKSLVELRKSQMSETEKSAARIKELEDNKSESDKKIERAEIQTSALMAGVSADKVERVAKLALSGDYEGTPAEKIAAVIKEFPEFVAPAGGATFGAPPKDESLNAMDTLLNRARVMAGLPAKK